MWGDTWASLSIHFRSMLSLQSDKSYFLMEASSSAGRWGTCKSSDMGGNKVGISEALPGSNVSHGTPSSGPASLVGVGRPPHLKGTALILVLPSPSPVLTTAVWGVGRLLLTPIHHCLNNCPLNLGL